MTKRLARIWRSPIFVMKLIWRAADRDLALHARILGSSTRTAPPDRLPADTGAGRRGPQSGLGGSKNSMAKKLPRLLAFVFFLKVAAPGTFGQFPAQPPPATYPAAAPLDDYFIPAEAAEIELARSAAPAAIASGAEVLVLDRDGYRTAVKGGNGFVCLVERSWAKATDDPEFWSPKISASICLNAPAARTYLPIVLLKTKLVLAGKSRLQIAQAVKSALDSKELPPLEPNAMCYMMSKQQYLSDDDMHWHPHMMWYVPGDAVQGWGANLKGVPAMAGYVLEDRMTVFLVAVGRWSDGTLAAQPMH